MDRLHRLKQSESDSTNILFPKFSLDFMIMSEKNLPINTPYAKFQNLISAANKDCRRKGLNQPDRFIPRRSSSDMEVAQFRISHNCEDLDDAQLDDVFENTIAAKKHTNKANNRAVYWEKMQKMSGRKFKNILNFGNHEPTRNGPGEMSLDDFKFLLQTSAYRPLPKKPEKALDLPNFVNNGSLNLLDWSKDSHLLLGLEYAAFVVDSTISRNRRPIMLEDDDAIYSAVLWTDNGRQMALGTSNGDVEIWDAETLKSVRTLTCEIATVNSLAWNQQLNVLSSGDDLNSIYHLDCRSPQPRITHFKAFDSGTIVTGLEFSLDGRYLAAGAEICEFGVFEGITSKSYFKQTINLRNKKIPQSVAWCPWKMSSLAIGGPADRKDGNISVWNIHSQEKLSEMNTDSPVTNVRWNSETKELVSSHGYPSAKVQIWKSSDLQLVGKLTGYSGYITDMVLSPNQTRLATMSSDEKLRIWKLIDKKKKRAKSCSSVSPFHQVIR